MEEMSENIWPKAASAAFALLALLAGWGLNKVYEVDQKVTRIETKLDIWTTPTIHPQASLSRLRRDDGIILTAMPYRAEQGEQFLQKAMVRACDQILRKDPEGALKTLLVGLDGVGIVCVPTGDHVECQTP